jgi:CheY-like chemotaxis protein/anti-sigma regulatory factor (Ser/Thr protein kinase)
VHAGLNSGGVPGAPYRVVIADDMADMRFLIARALRGSGHFSVVAEAENGEQALAAAREHQPDLTLLDLAMPVMDGLVALPLIRSAVPACRVVVLSGMDARNVVAEATAQGAAKFLVKGLPPQRLVEELLAIMAQEAATAGVGPDLRQATLELPCDLTSGREARRFLEQTLIHWGLDEILDEALLLASELVNNAVVHAQSSVDLSVSANEGRLRVEVTDHGVGALRLKEADMSATGGRGLFLVESLSRSWGTSADGERKAVWFEL